VLQGTFIFIFYFISVNLHTCGEKIKRNKCHEKHIFYFTFIFISVGLNQGNKILKILKEAFLSHLFHVR